MRESIQASLCADCGENVSLVEKTRHEVERDEYEGVVLNFAMSCEGCGETGAIQYREDGTFSTDEIDLSEAEYNQEDEEESDG